MKRELFLRGIRVKRPEDLDLSTYPFSLPFVRHFQELPLTCPVTFLVGENGIGKSTLLEAIAIAYGLNPEGGSRHLMAETVATHSCLSEYLTLIKGIKRPRDSYFLRAESFYNVISAIDQNAEEDPGEADDPGLLDVYGGKSLHAQSHGESFIALMTHRFFGQGMYFMDEPEAALSPQRQLSLLSILGEQVRKGSQFVIATHSPILMAFPGAQIFVLSEKGITLTPYEETEHYRITREFLNHPEAYLRHLIEED